MKTGRLLCVADLPVDGTYYVKEMYAPDGFVTTNEEQEFTFAYAGGDQPVASYEFTFENEPTTVELTKTDLTNGKELPGAHLQLTDEEGNVVEEWISTKEPHVIKELVVGKSYTPDRDQTGGWICNSGEHHLYRGKYCGGSETYHGR